MSRRWMLPAGIAAAVAILAVARPAPVTPAFARKTAVEPRVEPEGLRDLMPVAPPATKVEPEARRPTAPTTAERLGFDRSTAQAFEATRLVVRADLVRIQREMGKSFAAYPADLSDDALQDIQRRLEEQFRPEKEAALSRLEAFLDQRESHRQFREVLEYWAMEAGGPDP